MRVWEFLRWASWNPLWAGIFSGVFALMGAVIGGRYVLRSIEAQRRLDRLAAGRALSIELDLNLAATASLAIAGRTKPLDYLTFSPVLMLNVFDTRLTLFSALLGPAEFRALVSLYARASSSFSLLEIMHARQQAFTAGAVGKFTELSDEFALAARSIASIVWPEDEQKRQERTRSIQLTEVHNSGKVCGH